MPALIHHLTHPGDLTASAVVCGDAAATLGTWDGRAVTCPTCRQSPRRPRTWGMREKALQEVLRQACVQQGWKAYHVWQSRHSPEGWPDLVAVRDTRLLVAELKSAGGILTHAQEAWLEAWRGIRGAEVHVWRPDDLEQALEVLR